MREYIIPLNDTAEDWDEMFVAVIRKQEELIRCKDCKHWMKNPYRESSVFGLCFKHKDIAIATDETDWCSWAKRKDG